MTNSDATDAPSTSTSLAVNRTQLSYERTLMASVRTSTALVSFGFAIYKFFAYLQVKGQVLSHHAFGPRDFGFAMVATGVVYLALASLNHLRHTRAMSAQYHIPVRKLPLALSGLISVLGILGLLAIVVGQ